MSELDDPGLREVRDTGGRVTLAIHACRKPVIAAVNGVAVGIGTTMTHAMKRPAVVVGGPVRARFGKIGVTPEAASA